MIVYIKHPMGIYASPVFAEIGKSWEIKSVVLNKESDGLVLLPLCQRGVLKGIQQNYFYIDETLEEDWLDNGSLRGFSDIINNESLMKKLESGKVVPIEGIDIIKRYNLPLPVKYDFEVRTQNDILTFETICWSLHDSQIEEIKKDGKNIIINFDTTWQKHIIMTFHDVKETLNLDKVSCILDSTFKLKKDYVIWMVNGGFNLSWDGLKDDVYVKAKKITYKLLID